MDIKTMVRLFNRVARGVPLDSDESVVQKAVEYELRRHGTTFRSQPSVALENGKECRPDLQIADCLIELKVGDGTTNNLQSGRRGNRSPGQLATYLACPGVNMVVFAYFNMMDGTVTVTRKSRGDGVQKPMALAVVSEHSLVAASWREMQSEPLSQADYIVLKGAMRSHRDLLLLKVLRATGLRISELIGSRNRQGPRARSGVQAMDFHDEEYGRFYLTVQRAKKEGKPQYEKVYIPPELGVELRDYIKGLRIQPTERVFRLGIRRVEYIIRDAGRQALGRDVHPHELRGLYIKTLLDGGVPAPMAAKLVGHADSKTTERHYYDLTADQRWEVQRRMPV